MAAEKEKMAAHFPSINFFGANGRITSVQGFLRTNYGNSYYVRIEIPEYYPFVMPKISLPYYNIEPDCPHKFVNNDICVMRSEQWSQALSLAFIVAKTAIWLNKYDTWVRNGKARWPGKGQTH